MRPTGTIEGSDVDFVLVVPCFNEATRWRADYWRSVVPLPQIHWVFVDDGSTDHTAQLATEACEGGSAEVMQLPQNSGKAQAVRLGMTRALASMDHGAVGIGYLDADGAFAASDLERVLQLHRDGVADGRLDATWSARVALAGRSIVRSHARHYIGRAVATLVSLGDASIPYDTQAGFKVFAPSDTLRTCLADPFETRWLFEIELLTRWQGLTHRPMKIWEEPLLSWTEVPGSTIDTREALRIIRELYVVKRRQQRMRRGR